MLFTADLHIHSPYSRATSKKLTPPWLDYWAKIKGVTLVGSGDLTHPQWISELKETLEPAEEGLFRLKQSLVLPDNPVKSQSTRFILSGEISNIYKKNGRVRKVHNVVLAPSFDTAEKIQKALESRNFNIRSDGRPILGMDSRDLLEMLLEIDENIEFIPAHIWTPWFAALGSKSGFDTIQECFEDLTPHILAVETGLSSDQPLNRLCSFLDDFSLISNSDAHSPEKLGRNATIFNTELTYSAIRQALQNQKSGALVGTLDMYPQEGKYHFDGHRKCNISFNPVQTMQHEGLCPECGRPLTLGVAHRIAQLADRNNPEERPVKKEFRYIIPLKEIISEIQGVGPGSKRVAALYNKYIQLLGSERHILLNAPENKLRKAGGELLAEALMRMRQNQVITRSGFDGRFGSVKLFAHGELKSYGSNKQIFTPLPKEKNTQPDKHRLLDFDAAEFRRLKNIVSIPEKNKTAVSASDNKAQQEAAKTKAPFAAVTAGPGSGKTRVLTNRIKYLITTAEVSSEKIWAVSFTNQAAGEMRKRLQTLLGEEKAKALKISTFHAMGYDYLKSQTDTDWIIIDKKDIQSILHKQNLQKSKIKKRQEDISYYKNTLKKPDDPAFNDCFEAYESYKEKYGLADTDDLIYKPLQMIKTGGQLPKNFRFEHIPVDEFQDINPVQFEWLERISGKNSRIFAIGDPDQSVYAFRGSDSGLFTHFVKKYNAKQYRLQKSYRCPNTILKASALVVQSDNALKGTAEGLKIHISEQMSDKSEAEYIARTIEGLAGGLSFFSMDSKLSQGNSAEDIESLSDFAVLVRTKAQFAGISKALNDHSVPHRLIGSRSVFEQSPYKEIITALKYLQNPENQFLKEQSRNFPGLSHISHKKLSAKAAVKWLKKKYFPDKPAADDDNYMFFLTQARDKSIEEFLKTIALRSGPDDYNPQTEAVNVMTLHASKGLEFKAVFIAGCETKLLPYSLYRKSVNIEEERRLLYVGMTRAEKYLFLSYAKQRKLGGRLFHFPPSPFIDDIEQSLLQRNENKYKRKPKDTQQSLF